MPTTCCCVPGCHNRGGHKFPSSTLIKKKWIHAVRRGRENGREWTPNASSVVCARHFNDDDYLQQTMYVSDLRASKPSWTCTVSVRTEFLLDRISEYTPGFRAVNNNTIVLHDTGSKGIEGARWSRGYTSGKHVIEFIYPVHTRGLDSRIGIGTLDTPLGAKKASELVGGKKSWAVDLVKKRVFQNGSQIGYFPPEEHVLPDWFFMYMDLDEGVVHFGSDGQFYGTAFTDVTVTPGTWLFPMVTASNVGSVISMVYRGQGKEVNGPLRKIRTTPGALKTWITSGNCQKSDFYRHWPLIK